MNQLDAFEQRIRDVLEPFEVPYNSADWAQMEKALDSGRKSSWWGGLGFYAALLAGALAIGGTTYLISRTGSNDAAGNEVAQNGHGTGSMSDVPPSTDPDNDPSDHQTMPATAAVSDEESTTSAENGDLAQPASPRFGKDGTLPSVDAAKPAKTTGLDAQRGDRTGAPSVRDLPVRDERSGNDQPGAEGAVEMTIRPSVTEGCPGTTVEFAAEHLPEEGIFLWNFGDGSFSNKPNPSHTYSKSGRFEVMLSHSSMAGGNIRNKPSSDLIVIHEAPEGDFLPQRQSYVGHLPSVHFENRSLGGMEYHWDFGDGVTSAVPHPDHVFRKKGTYHVELVVTNARGCVDRVEKEVVVEHDYNLLAPEAFSPNGDGTNDLFIPEALRELELRFKLSIHDPASGELVYETTDASKPWTGRVMNRGDLCAPGTYVWVVEFPDALHLSDIPFQGEVTLVR